MLLELKDPKQIWADVVRVVHCSDRDRNRVLIEIKMRLTHAVYVLTRDDEGAVIDGPVQAVEAPEEDDEHDEEIGNQIDLILAKVEAQYRASRSGHKWKSTHARAFVLLACRKGLLAAGGPIWAARDGEVA